MNDLLPAPQFNLARQWRFTLKELREVLRDRRTIMTLVLMPLLLYPLLAIAMQQLFQANTQPAPANEIRVGFVNPADLDQFKREVQPAYERAKRRRGALGHREGQSPQWLAQTEPKLSLLQIDRTPLGDLEEGKVQIVLQKELVKPPPNWPAGLPSPSCYIWRMSVLDGSREGAASFRYLRSVLALAQMDFLEENTELNFNANPVPTQWVAEETAAPPRKSVGVISTLIPLILVLMTITGAVYPAIDLTAGERERGTLEVLMAAPVPRLWLLLAKLAAVWTVSLLTALINLGMMTLTILATGLGPLLFGPDGVTPLLVVQVLGLLMLFALFFSAVLLSLTSFARSFKEAQAYLVPLMLLALAPGVATLLPDMPLRGPLAVTPLMNVVLLARDLFANDADPQMAILVVASTLLYAALALWAAAHLFGAEAVLYADHAGWNDILRRPAVARDTASVSGALLCLALLFTTQFLLIRAIALVVPETTVLSVASAAATLLYLGFPLIGAVMQRVRLVSGFAVSPPSLMGLAGALFLGLSLWPFAALLGLLIKQFLPQTLEIGLGDQVQKLIAIWRQSPYLMVVLIGLLPPIYEELLFRGYLFSALLAVRSPRSTILISALVFAVFHVVVGSLLSWERFLISGLLGVVLGWVRWRTGSVWPGMLLHACHNCILVLAALARDAGPLQMKELDWKNLLPWLGAGAAGAVMGAALVMISRRRAVG